MHLFREQNAAPTVGPSGKSRAKEKEGKPQDEKTVQTLKLSVPWLPRVPTSVASESMQAFAGTPRNSPTVLHPLIDTDAVVCFDVSAVVMTRTRGSVE